MMTTAPTLPRAFLGQGWRWGGFVHPWFFLGILFWLVPLLVFGLIVFLFARWAFKPDGRGNRQPSGSQAVAILEERYAKGEITKEQFVQMKRDLQP